MQTIHATERTGSDRQSDASSSRSANRTPSSRSSSSSSRRRPQAAHQLRHQPPLGGPSSTRSASVWLPLGVTLATAFKTDKLTLRPFQFARVQLFTKLAGGPEAIRRVARSLPEMKKLQELLGFGAQELRASVAGSPGVSRR